MKKWLMGLLVCLMGVGVQAFIIDDLDDENMSEYTISRVNDGNTEVNVSFSNAGGDLRTVYTGAASHEQVLLLRDDYSLQVGEMLMAEVSGNESGWDRDIGIAVGYTATPPALGAGQTGDVRTSYVEVSYRSNNQVMSYARNGTTNLSSGQEFSGTDYGGDTFNGYVDYIFIERLSETEFQAGWIQGDTTHVLTENGNPIMPYVITTDTPGAAVGFYTDARAAIAGSPTGLDNLEIWNNLYGPHEPTPEDGAPHAGTASGGSVDVPLSWQAGVDPENTAVVNPDITKHYVFLSSGSQDDPNLYYEGTVSQSQPDTDPNTTFGTVSGLAENTAYNWAVVEALAGHDGQTFTAGVTTIDAVDPNNIIGPTWNFTTATGVPIIDPQPVSTNIPVGQPADPAFSIGVTSATTESYQWFYSTDDVIDDPGDTPIDGAVTDSLSIAGVALSDQGYYYCRVTNSVDSIYSDVVILVAGRMVGEYLFDGDLTDETTEDNHGQGKTVSGLPEPNSLLATNTTLAFDTGVNGTGLAVVLTAPDEYIDFGTGAYPKAGSLINGIGGGMEEGAITCWVKTTQADASNVVLGNYNSGVTTGFAFSLTANAGAADTRMNMRGEAADVGTQQGRLTAKPGWDMLDNEWHMIGASWTAGDTLAVYVDGEQVISGTAGTPAEYAPWQRSVLLGAGRDSTNRNLLNSFFGGAVDNLRIYNYARTPEQMANEYYTTIDQMACTNHDFAGSIFNVDNEGLSYCKVDLADFADFAASWLTTGLSTGE